MLNSQFAIISDVDIRLMMAVNSLVGRSAAFDHLIQIMEAWHLALYGWMAAYVWALWFENEDENSRSRLLAGLIGVGVATPLSVILQRLLSIHPRPFLQSSGLDITLIESPRLSEWYVLNSFPSDTLTMCFALSTAIYLLSKKVGLFAFFWTAIVVAFPRIYLAYHWPLDIVGSLLLGPITVLLIARLSIVKWFSLFLFHFERLGPRYFYPLAFIFTQQVVELFHGSELGIRLAGKLIMGNFH
jgi:undecaprenyl-diphosphatase